MSKTRVYEYAKQNNLSSKAVIQHLKEMDIEVANHMSTITDATKGQLDEKINPSKKSEPKQNTGKQKQQSSGPSKGQKETNKDGNKRVSQKPSKKGHKPGNKQQPYKKHGKNRGGKKDKQQPPKKEEKVASKATPEKIVYHDVLTVEELAGKLHKDTSEIIKKLMFLGVMATKNQDLDDDAIELISDEYGVEVEKEIILEDTDFDKYKAEDDPKDLKERPAVVTIMGHVDHGKTTLLDSIRSTKVTAGEAGGITQHIGAYQVEEDGKKITFLDTPGHAAFTSMRSRGAQITDIAILVVAADDGVMPQTVEAINHAKAADVPIIVAVNKVDKPAADPDRVKQELLEYELVPEEWGGDTIFVEISALFNQNIDELLEMILLVAEVAELTADPTGLAVGSVLEARLDRSKGPIATLLVQNGTLKQGDSIVVGTTYGRIRTMINDQGIQITEAGPSTPIEITGLNNTPNAGDQFVVFEDERTARQIAETRSSEATEEQRQSVNKVTLENLFDSLEEGEMKEVNIIVKGDVRGSVEALVGSLEQIEVDGVRIKVVHTGVGAINETDVTLASASHGIIIGFNVRPTPQASENAKAAQVEMRTYRGIYDAIDELEAAMKEMLDLEYQEQVTGQATVRETYNVSSIGRIAGALVNNGVIKRTSSIRLIRDGIVVHEGELGSLRRFDDDVREVQNRSEEHTSELQSRFD